MRGSVAWRMSELPADERGIKDRTQTNTTDPLCSRGRCETMLVDVWDGGDSARDGGGRGGKRRWLTLNNEPALFSIFKLSW